VTTAVFVVLGLAAFAAAYGQAPLYYSNQNQYFLHGLAAAGDGLLAGDWLAQAADPTPIFSALAAVTARFLHPWMFHLYQALLLAVYAAAMLGLFAWLVGSDVAMRRWPVFLTLAVAVHSALVRWLSFRLLGLDYPWYAQAGVAGQYLLGPMLQPSVFGVLLLAAVCLFARGQEGLAIVCVALAATIHSTYLLPAGLLTAGFLTSLLLARQFRRAVFLGGLALVLVLPVTAYVVWKFAPTSPEIFSEAQDVLVNVRIPHHCRPDLWLDPIAVAQLAWIGIGLALLWRTRLFAALAVTALLAVALTLVQVATGSNTLALLFPWRISAVLVPIATAVIFARVVAIRRLPLDGTVARVSAAVLLVALALAGIGICAGGLAFRSDDRELRLLDYVREHRQPGDVYLIPVRVPALKSDIRGSKSSDFEPIAQKRQDAQVIPVGLQRFRLYTGAPIFVDFKSIPYRDTDVVEWRDRLLRTQRLYEQIHQGKLADAVAEMRRLGVTHLVVGAGASLPDRTLTRLPLEDASFQLFRLEPE
jgi:hypothetical protein